MGTSSIAQAQIRAHAGVADVPILPTDVYSKHSSQKQSATGRCALPHNTPTAYTSSGGSRRACEPLQVGTADLVQVAVAVNHFPRRILCALKRMQPSQTLSSSRFTRAPVDRCSADRLFVLLWICADHIAEPVAHGFKQMQATKEAFAP